MSATVTIDANGSISLPAACETTGATLVDRDGFPIFTGTEPFEAVEVIAAARVERDNELSARRAR